MVKVTTLDEAYKSVDTAMPCPCCKKMADMVRFRGKASLDGIMEFRCACGLAWSAEMRGGKIVRPRETMVCPLCGSEIPRGMHDGQSANYICVDCRLKLVVRFCQFKPVDIDIVYLED